MMVSGTTDSQVRGHPAACATRRAQRQGPERAGEQATDQPEADLLDHEPERLGFPTALGRGEGERDEQQRHAQTVVQPALDVQALADAQRHPLVGDHGRAEGRIGRRHGDRQENGLDRRRAPAGRPAPPRCRAAIVNGSPIPSRRAGRAISLRNLRRSIFEASTNRTRAEGRLGDEAQRRPVAATSNQPSTASPRRMPAVRKTIAGVRTVRSSQPEKTA